MKQRLCLIGETGDTIKFTNVLVLSGGSLVPQVFECLRDIPTANFLVGDGRDTAFRHSPLCHGFARFSFGDRDPDDLKDLIDRIDRTRGVDVVLGCDCRAILPMIRLGSRIRQKRFPLPSLADFITHNDKWLFHDLCRKCGVPTPKTLRFSDKSEIGFEYLREELGLPFVVKPTNLESCRGVLKIDGKDTFERCLRNDPCYSFAPLIAQEYIPGTDIDLSLLVSRGKILCHAVQIVLGGVTHFVRADDLLAMGRRLVAHTGFNGVVHFDARFDSRDRSFKFIESNPRFWASVTRAKACGLNFVAAGIAHALGRPIETAGSIEGRQYQATQAFFRRLLTAEVPVTELQWATVAEILHRLSDPATLVLRKYTRLCECAEQRRQRRASQRKPASV